MGHTVRTGNLWSVEVRKMELFQHLMGGDLHTLMNVILHVEALLLVFRMVISP